MGLGLRVAGLGFQFLEGLRRGQAVRLKRFRMPFALGRRCLNFTGIICYPLLLRPGPTVDDIHLALPIIRNIPEFP